MPRQDAQSTTAKLLVCDGRETEQCCCSNRPIYEITYSLGTKWQVCNECLEIECFNSDIKEKVRIRK